MDGYEGKELDSSVGYSMAHERCGIARVGLIE